MPRSISTMSAAELADLSTDLKSRYEALRHTGLKLNMSRGIPAPAQLDLMADLLDWKPKSYLAEDGTDCRNYGVLQGLPEARRLFSSMLGASPENVVIGDNSSLALMHDCVAFALLGGTGEGAQPWSNNNRAAFLCPVPGYDRHFAICETFGIEMISVPMTGDGPDMEIVERHVANNPAIKGMWCVPKYSNPTGAIYSSETIKRLAAMKTAAPDFRLFWDNSYAVHHLTSELIQIDNVLELSQQSGHPDRALVFGSTSKITLAGGGLALFASSRQNVEWLLHHRSRQTIGPDKINQLRHVHFLKDAAGIAALMDQHRAIIAPKFNKIYEVFDRELGGAEVARWTRPKGGYFISLDVWDGCAGRIIALAKELGVVLTPAGATYPGHRDPADRNIRIAPTYPSLEDINRAAQALALCTLIASVDQRMSNERPTA